MVLFLNGVRQLRSPAKMAATVQLRCYWKQLWSRWAITGSWEPLVLDIVLVHLYFSACFGYYPCTSLFFYWFWILSLYIFIFLLVLDIVLVHFYFSTDFGYCPCASLIFYMFLTLSLCIFNFLLVLDIVLVHLYFSACFGYCPCTSLFFYLFWRYLPLTFSVCRNILENCHRW